MSRTHVLQNTVVHLYSLPIHAIGTNPKHELTFGLSFRPSCIPNLLINAEDAQPPSVSSLISGVGDGAFFPWMNYEIVSLVASA